MPCDPLTPVPLLLLQINEAYLPYFSYIGEIQNNAVIFHKYYNKMQETSKSDKISSVFQCSDMIGHWVGNAESHDMEAIGKNRQSVKTCCWTCGEFPGKSN